MKIKIKSPTRIDFAGGTLDCWPLYLFVDEAVTINLSISIFTNVELKTSTGQEVKIKIKDLGKTADFSNVQEFLADPDPAFALVQAVVRYFSPKRGFELMTSSESPVGAGLGGSSSLVISLIKAFLKMSKKKMTTEKMVELAHNLEARLLKTPTGTQDYVPAIDPGFYCIHYHDDKFKIEPLKINKKALGDHLSIIYTGRAHHSGMNNWAVIKAVVEGDVKTQRALKELSLVSLSMRDAIRANNWDAMSELFTKETEIRLRLAPSFLSPEIIEIDSFVKGLSSASMKVCGAGGGGCVFVWSKEKKEVRNFCAQKGFQYLEARPVI